MLGHKRKLFGHVPGCAGLSYALDGLYFLLSISLTVPPFVEHFQQRDDPCHIGFYALAFLSFTVKNLVLNNTPQFAAQFQGCYYNTGQIKGVKKGVKGDNWQSVTPLHRVLENQL